MTICGMTETRMNTDQQPTLSVLEYYGLHEAGIHPIHVGNINRSFLVTTPDSHRFVLQRVNPMFAPLIHEDIEAVTRHIESKGLLTPHLVPTTGGDLYVTEGDVCWRLFDYIPGYTHAAVEDETVAYEAASLLARFHKALLDMDYEFRHVRPGVHDTARHLHNLQTALEQHRHHPRYDAAATLASEILAASETLVELPEVPARKVHGDPKITNVIFDPATGQAKCLVDLDTLSVMPLYLELGDAFRSWCNPRGEDTAETCFSLPLFHAAVRGYASEAASFILEDEWRSILPATYRIYIELAARFCADILNESFFNWDPRLFSSCSEHNEVRARGQLRAAGTLREVYAQAEEIVERAFREM
jgi:Ser/Thr protein kinase RdoA (MazF antagonist)